MVPSRDGVEVTLSLMVGMRSSLALRMSRESDSSKTQPFQRVEKPAPETGICFPKAA